MKRKSWYDSDYQIGKVMAQLGQTCCQECGTARRLTRDHVIPLFRRGLDGLANMQILCEECNFIKRAKIKHNPVEIVLSTSLYYKIKVVSRLTGINNFGNKVSKSMLQNVNKFTVIPVAEFPQIIEYFYTYTRVDLENDLKELKTFLVPEDSKFIIKFDPKFNVSKEAIIHFLNRQWSDI